MEVVLNISKVLLGALLFGASLSTASAFPQPVVPTVDSQIIQIAQGCGPGAWRGPWGGCRDTPYSGPLPGGGYAYPSGGYGYFGNGCPPGYWRGPWGHCRNTPYHGRLPNGNWQ